MWLCSGYRLFGLCEYIMQCGYAVAICYLGCVRTTCSVAMQWLYVIWVVCVQHAVWLCSGYRLFGLCEYNMQCGYAVAIHVGYLGCVRTTCSWCCSIIIPHWHTQTGIPYLTAEVGFGTLAKLALSTLRNVQWDHMISRLNRKYTFSHTFHYTSCANSYIEVLY